MSPCCTHDINAKGNVPTVLWLGGVLSEKETMLRTVPLALTTL